MTASSHFSLTNSFWQMWLNAKCSRRDSAEILVAHRSIVWRPQAQEKHFQLFTCLFTVSNRTCFLHIWKAHIACMLLSSTISHPHCQHYWYYLSQPFDTNHMFSLLLNILFYSVIDVIRCKSSSGRSLLAVAELNSTWRYFTYVEAQSCTSYKFCWTSPLTILSLLSRYVSCALGCPYEGQVKPSQVTKVLT